MLLPRCGRINSNNSISPNNISRISSTSPNNTNNQLGAYYHLLQSAPTCRRKCNNSTNSNAPPVLYYSFKRRFLSPTNLRHNPIIERCYLNLFPDHLRLHRGQNSRTPTTPGADKLFINGWILGLVRELVAR